MLMLKKTTLDSAEPRRVGGYLSATSYHSPVHHVITSLQSACTGCTCEVYSEVIVCVFLVQTPAAAYTLTTVANGCRRTWEVSQPSCPSMTCGCSIPTFQRYFLTHHISCCFFLFFLFCFMSV